MCERRYKPLSSLAVASFVAALFGGFSFWLAPLVIIAGLALIAALQAIQSIRRYELAGASLASIAITMSASCAVFAPTWHWYRFTSESLPGYTRVSFGAVPINGLDVHDGKPICLKGYSVSYGGESTGRFLLSPDGDFEKPEATISIMYPSGWQRHRDAMAVSGVLHVDPAAEEQHERYTLSAVSIERASSSFQLLPRVPGDW